MRDIIAVPDFQFEEFDPTTAALENPEIEVPRSYSSNMRLEKGRNIVRFVSKMKDRPLFQQVVDGDGALSGAVTADDVRALFGA